MHIKLVERRVTLRAEKARAEKEGSDMKYEFPQPRELGTTMEPSTPFWLK